MKYFLISLLVTIVFIQCSKVNEKQKCHLEEDNLKGEVQSISTKKFSIKNAEGELIKGKLIDRELTIYNQQGNILEDIMFFKGKESKSGKRNDKYIYIYDKDGKLLKIERYDSDNEYINTTDYYYDHKGNIIIIEMKSLDHKVLYKWDNDDNLVEKAHCNLEELNCSRTLYKYDEKGNILEEIDYDLDSKFQEKYQYEYDSLGNRILTEVYDSNMDLTIKWFDKYDELRNLIERKTFKKSDSILTIQNKYEFDEQMNWVTCKTYSNNVLKTIVEREIKYY